MATKNLTIEEAERALERAREVEAERARAERAAAEQRAQREHDAEQSKLVDALEREVEGVFVDAAKLASSQPISRGASQMARSYLVGDLTAPPMKSRLLLVCETDQVAMALLGAFETVASTLNKLTINRRQGTRNLGPELGQRLADL